MITFKSRSAEDTKSFGKKIGKFLRGGDVVALVGPLGAGKTTLTKGIALGLSVKSEEEVSSPTFVVIHEYQGREKIYHIDWYRLERVEGADEAMAQECFSSGGVTLVEWPERGKNILPEDFFEIKLHHRAPEERDIEVSASGKENNQRLKNLKNP